MKKFKTISIEKKRCLFQYCVETNNELTPPRVKFKVFSIPKQPDRYFEYTFIIIDQETARGYWVSINNNPEFSKKGIPERIIEIASDYLHRDIQSSPIVPEHQVGQQRLQPVVNRGNIPNEGDKYLVTKSKEAWERLVAANCKASRDNANNYFILKKKKQWSIWRYLAHNFSQRKCN